MLTTRAALLPPPPPPPPPPHDPSPFIPQGIGLESEDGTSLGIEQFLTLLVHLAFFRDNPRFTPVLAGAPKLQSDMRETVPVLQCVTNMITEFLPKMRKGDTAEFRQVVKGDAEAAAVLAAYTDKVAAWTAALHEKAEKTNTDVMTQYIAALEETGSLGVRSLETTNASGTTVMHKASLTEAQARHSFLDTQNAMDLAVASPKYEVSHMLEALARCGDKKYATVIDMTLKMRVEGMLKNVLNEATELEILDAATFSVSDDLEGSAAYDEKVKAAVQRNWLVVWKNMTFKDMYGYPLWETQLHDVLQSAFPELQSIFLHYTGSSIAGSESIASATKLGLMEVLSLAKDCDICTKEFKVDDLSRHFSTSNAGAAIATSGSADRHKMPSHGSASGVMTIRDKALSARKKKAEREGKGGAKAADKADMQLNLFEFINFLVRIAFWRANPMWGSKYNKMDLTPVPDATSILLEECILPNARRDTSAEFKKVLAGDAATQAVLVEYRAKLQAWVRPLLRKERRIDNPNPQMTYRMWAELMDGPEPNANAFSRAKAACPKMVGEWFLTQESQITGDERTSKKNQMTFKASLSLAQARWNFLRSQAIEQIEGGEVDAEGGKDGQGQGTLDFSELNECICRCAVNMYEHLLDTYLPSHNRKAMTMADAVRSWIQNLFFEKSPEMCMWEATVIKADRYDWQKQTKMLPGFSPATHKLWLQVWDSMMLMDIHHFPLWEKGVHDTLQQLFPVLMRIFSNYTKGVSGIDSAADALEMELEEFHDFIKDAKLETRMINFTTMTNVFAKANAANTADAMKDRQAGKRNVQVQREMEQMARDSRNAGNDGKKENPKEVKAIDALAKHLLADRFANDYPEPGSMKVTKPDNRLTLTEFCGCLVRISFLRANPKHGQYDNKAKLIELPGCLKKMLEEVVIPNAKQDMSSLFRDEIAQDAEVQAVCEEYRDRLFFYYSSINALAAAERANAKLTKGGALEAKEQKLALETWMDISRGYLFLVKKKGMKHMEARRFTPKGGDGPGLGEGAIVGDCTVMRESDITGDERCKEKYTCRLSILEAKYAFLNSQSLEQMAAGDAGDNDAMATLDYDEFIECLARCARDKYGEIKLMSLADGVRGIFMNILGEKSDEGVIRDATYIHAERYNWKLSKPLPGQTLAAHRKWLDCWQNIEIGDLHYFPLWEKGVFDCLQECFQDLTNIFAHYAKSIGGSTTAEDAVEMTMTEFKELVKDVGLETKDLKFDVMSNMFKKANATNSGDVRKQRMVEKGNADAQGEFAMNTGTQMALKKNIQQASPKRNAKLNKIRDDELDQELVLYEFVEVMIRIGFWRANPFHGINKLAAKLVPLPDCLHQMLHEVVLPNAKRDDSALFKERLAGDKAMLSALATYEKRLKEWFDVHTQSMFLRGEGRKLQYQQWQDLLKKGWGADARAQGYTPGNGVGNWEIFQDSEITGDERCRNKFKISLSLPQAKFAFINSQSLDQLSVGQAKDTDAMTTLEFDEFKECIARCALDKYKPIRQMSPAVMITSFCKNLLGEENTEECMNTATLIKAERYNWKRYSVTLPGQALKDHKKWLQVWQRLDIGDMYYFPLWEKGVHDVLQKHFKDLCLIFFAYCRSMLGSASAEDAAEMEMAEFKDFVDECGLETKQISFDLMSNNFMKANAINSAQVRDAHQEGRRSAGTKMDGRTTAEVATQKRNDGSETKKDAELVLYEFIGMLVRIAFQRANPTFGNYGNKKAVVHLVNYPGSGMEGNGCLQTMIEDEILPRARKDTSAVFRETVMTEMSVVKVLDEYRPKIKAWYDLTCADDTKQTTITDKLQMDQWKRICDEKDLVGTWSCFRESDISGHPGCKTEYKWRLSMSQASMAFIDSNPRQGEGSINQQQAGQSTGTDSFATLDLEEFLECCARCGMDMYRAVKEVSPANAVKGFMQNLLGEASPDEVVVRATYIKCDRYDAKGLTKPLKGESQVDLDKWIDCWQRMEIMDVYLWPLWEKEVHDIMHALFKELQSIFLAYCRSIFDQTGADATEMSLDEFHDFVVDVGLETKKYKFEQMCNAFIKANAINTAQVHAQKKDLRRDKDSKSHDAWDFQKATKEPGKVKMGDSNYEAKKDQELDLAEFMNMMVRIGFWRANPGFGLHGNKDEVVSVPLALSTMLNEVILPRAKRESTAEFRTKEMTDPKVLTVLDQYKSRLREWYDKKVADDSDDLAGKSAGIISDKLQFEEWLRVLDRQDIVGVWEVEQMSEITGDESTRGNIKIRLSIPTCKVCFVDSQSQKDAHTALMGGKSDEASDQATLDFDEWLECCCRTACKKYSAIKQMDASQKVKSFMQNFFGEATEEDCVRTATYIRAVRFDLSESRPLKDESPEEHAAFLTEFKQLDLQGLYGFPLWEAEVHDLLHANFRELASIFRSYCKSVGEASSDDSSKTMDLEEFNDFVIDCMLETNFGQAYTFENMKEQFSRADKSGKGLAGPQANAELVLYEFLNVITRISFWRINPECGELEMDHQDTILPVPQCLEKTLRECILPKAHRDDAGQFRGTVMQMPEVQASLAEGRPRLQAWYATIPLDDNQKVGITQWVSALQALNVIGTFTCTQGSDIVGDDRVGTEFKCRLSVPQAKAAFVNAQKETGGAVDDTTLDFDELLECIARCGVDKYRAVEQIKPGEAVSAMIANILGDLNEEQVITTATYITAERFTPATAPPKGVSPDAHREWLMTWEKLQLSLLPGFPLWEKDVHDVLAGNLESLQSIFKAYAAGTIGTGAQEMDMEEFHDFCIEANLVTDMYGFDAMSGQFTKANAGSNDTVLELHEFLTMLVRISFFRANPQYGMRLGKDQKNADKFGEEVPLPGCLSDMLTNLVLPNARHDTYAQEFAETTLPLPEVQAALGAQLDKLSSFYELVSAGRAFLEIDQWLNALTEKLLFSDLNIDGYVVRLTEPQAKAAFYASAATPSSGLLPDELPVCVARTACDKYKGVTPMGPGAKVTGFLANLLGDDDEEDVVLVATGGVAKAKPVAKAKRYSADGMLMADEEMRATGISSGTAAMLMPDERDMAHRDKFETKGYDARRDNIAMSQGASMADERKGLHGTRNQ